MASRTLKESQAAEPLDAKEERKIQAQEEIDEKIKICRSILTARVFSAATVHAYEENMAELRRDLKVEWMKDYDTFMRQTQADAEAYEEKFLETIRRALEEKWISPKDMESMKKKFYRSDWLELKRKEWLDKDNAAGFHQELKRKKAASIKRMKLAEKAHEQNVEENTVSVKKIRQAEEFGEKDIEQREEIVESATEDIRTEAEKREKLVAQAIKTIEQYGKGSRQCLNEKEIATWTQNVQEQRDPNVFMLKIFLPAASEALYKRSAFDDARRNIPSSPTVAQWLALDEAKRHQCTATLRAEQQQMEVEANDAKQQYERLQQELQQALIQYKWHDAFAILGKLKTHPLIRETDRAQYERMIAEAQEKEEEEMEKTTLESQQALRMLIGSMQSTIRTIYSTVCERGLSAFITLEYALKQEQEARKKTSLQEVDDQGEKDILSMDDQQALAQSIEQHTEKENAWKNLLTDKQLSHILHNTHPKLRTHLESLKQTNSRFRTKNTAA